MSGYGIYSLPMTPTPGDRKEDYDKLISQFGSHSIHDAICGLRKQYDLNDIWCGIV